MINKFEIQMTKTQNGCCFEYLDFGFDRCVSFEICQLNIITK